MGMLDKFKAKLRDDLSKAYQSLGIVTQDKRISGFIKVLQDNGQNLFVGSSRVNQQGPAEKLSLSNFDFMLKSSFPPCMRWAVEAQRDQKKRLKHQGKLQLRPFLREAGFGLQDSLSWWRREVTLDREVDESKFEKNFSYDIEHAYG